MVEKVEAGVPGAAELGPNLALGILDPALNRRVTRREPRAVMRR